MSVIGLLPLDVMMVDESQPQAAVMVLLNRQNHSVLLIHKAEFLRRHAGEMAFPGGKLEVSESLLACAQRECLEEVAIAATQYELLGCLPQHFTRHKVAVSPFVAEMTSSDYCIQIDRSELQDAFWIPLSALMNEENHRQRDAEIDGEMLSLHYFDYQRESVEGVKNHQIWGVTAHIIRDLLNCDLEYYL